MTRMEVTTDPTGTTESQALAWAAFVTASTPSGATTTLSKRTRSRPRRAHPFGLLPSSQGTAEQ